MTPHLMNSSPTWSINIFKTERIRNLSPDPLDYKSSKKIAKIDGKQLTNLMIQYNVGVTTEYTYEVKKIDKDFFEE